jgi:hypothetical protein
VGDGLDSVAEAQDGVVTRAQALAAGLTASTIRCHLGAGRWQRLGRGVYATFSGPVSREALLWAAVLAAGDGAMLSHETAAELCGLVDQPSAPVHVTVPGDRRTAAPGGVRHHISSDARATRHPTRTPPQTRVEDTVVDLTQSARDVAAAANWVIRACARRLTTPERLRDALARRPKLRWRRAIAVALEDVGEGCHSMLELAYRRRVERAHGLPAARRQAARARRGGRWYDDVRYSGFATVVELDGSVAHPSEAAGRDNRRDNAGTVAGLSVLRYRVDDVVGGACAVAREVAEMLRRNGWAGRARRCGPTCVIAKDWCGPHHANLS